MQDCPGPGIASHSRYRAPYSYTIVSSSGSVLLYCLHAQYWDTGSTHSQHKPDPANHTAEDQEKMIQDTETDADMQDTIIKDTIVNYTEIQDTKIQEEKVQDTEIQDTMIHDTPKDESIILRQMADGPAVVEDEEESWEDFGWETTTKVTIPSFLLEDIGGNWGEDFQEEWEEGWD